MSALPPSSRDRRPSSRGRNAVSASLSSRYETGSMRHSSEGNSSSTRPTRADQSSRTRRRSHSTGVPPKDETATDEVAARLERREERRRRRELEGGHETTRSPRRSSSLPRRPVERSEPSSSDSRSRSRRRATSPYTGMSRSGSGASRRSTDSSVYADESLDKVTPLASKKAAYLRALERGERLPSRRLSDESQESDSLRISRSRSSEEPSSPDVSSRSRRRRSHLDHGSPSKKERKSRRSSEIIADGKSEIRTSADGELSRSELSRSGSSGDKSRKREKKPSRTDDGRSSKSKSSKDKKRSSKSKEERSAKERRRSSREEVAGESENRDRERRRSSKNGVPGDSERRRRRSSVIKDELSGDDIPNRERRTSRRELSGDSERHKDRKHRSRSSDGLKSSRSEEYRRKRREERLAGGDDVTREEEYHKRREERLAQREERRVSESSRSSVRSSSVPKSSDFPSRDDLRPEQRTTSAGAAVSYSTKSSSDSLKERMTSTSTNIFGARSVSEGDADQKNDLHGPSSAEAARERLRQRMAARERAKDAVASDQPLESSARDSQQNNGNGALPVARPKLVDVNRRGIASVLKHQRPNASPPTPSSSESDSDEESSTAVDVEFGDDESSSAEDEDEERWTVRVSVISAVDLPLNVVPNMPLCPVLKFGLITLPATDDANGKTDVDDDKRGVEGHDSSDAPSSAVALLEKSGLTSVPKARVRCTSNKILSKRDNGSVEFHEEMRWDRVKRPMRAALVVELSARAALPPPNAKESPFIKQAEAASGVATRAAGTDIRSRSRDLSSGMVSEARNLDMRRNLSEESTGGNVPAENENSASAQSTTPQSLSGVADKDTLTPAVPGAGLTGMRALWQRGRQQFEQRQVTRLNTESSSDALAEQPTTTAANFLVGGKGAATSTASGGEVQPSSIGQGFTPRQPATERSAPSLEDENVALLMPKKKKRKLMAEDLRLGSLVIPLTRLPLDKAIQNKEAARIEQWYQLDANDVLISSQSTPTWRGKSVTKPPPRRSPTVQLEISFSPPEVLDESEDEMDELSVSELGALTDDTPDDEPSRSPSEQLARPAPLGSRSKSFSRRLTTEKRLQEQKESTSSKPVKKKVPEDPALEPGLVDYICVVGVNSIGDQKDDDGSKGWVNTSPECTLLERFPPEDEFHVKNGRNVALPNKVEWFCFPDGWKLWRGNEPPSPADININRFASSTSAIVSSTVSAFDTCLGVPTSFSWFVIASNSDEYGSRNVKTYGAVIKFFAPAPKGIDQTQDDFAQTLMGVPIKAQTTEGSTAKRLWVPLGICLTSNFPIVGVMEAMLLRICEALVAKTGSSLNSVDSESIRGIIQKDIAELIINFQTPISGVLHCSVPFLSGARLHVTLPPPTGLPPLPHGSSVKSVCRLLGAEGLNLMLAALLTECKILLHSEEVANLAMVAEVVTALIYPFYWALPYIPVLPDAMLEFVEAPLSYFLGVTTSSLKLIDPIALEDVVVVDLDSGFGSPDYFEGRRTSKASKTPTPLPSSVATKISKAVFRLLREEGEVEDEYGTTSFVGAHSLPRLESESLAEREFRIAVALQVCGLVRGYDDCLFKVSASQPVFNRDKFLRTAPALFENQRGNLPLGGPGSSRASRTLSPRSKRFLSILVNCQHFHQFLQTLDEDECAFFNEVMYTFDVNDEQEDDRMLGGYGTSASTDDAAAHLSKALQKVEDKIPTYRVERSGKKKHRSGGGWDDDDDIGIQTNQISPEKGRERRISDDSFPFNLLQPLCLDPKPSATESQPSAGDEDSSAGSTESSKGVHSLSVQYLMELEKGNWKYEKLFDIPTETEENVEKGDSQSFVSVREKVRLREAIGERRYRAWKIAQEQKFASDDSAARLSTGDALSPEGNPALDLTSLLSSMTDDATSDTSSVTQSTVSHSSQKSARASTLSPEQQRVADAKDRDVLRRCLERAYEGGRRRSDRRRPSEEDSGARSGSDPFYDKGRDLIAEAETALRNPSAQRFLVSVLSQRSRLENQRKRRSSIIENPNAARRQSTQTSVSRLETSSFECLVRLCCAMLDSCMESKDYEPAYGLLTHTAGFCTVQQTQEDAGFETDADDDIHHPGNKVIYMTARIGLHPIFADLRLWEEVLRLHLKDRENDKNPGGTGAAIIGKANSSDLVEYEAAVATLYEMLGFGIPSEELARFATRVSQENGWFETERGHSLLMLARRLGVRREQGEDGGGTTGELDLMGSSRNLQGASGPEKEPDSRDGKGGAIADDSGQLEWTDIGWCHPAAPSAVRAQHLQPDAGGDEKDLFGSKRLKRSAVTSVASFGSSIVASGGLDGSVFVAHTIQLGQDADGKRSENVVQGVHLDWGSSGSRTAAVASSLSSMDGEYGVGAISCLAAAKGAGYRSSALSAVGSATKDVRGKADEDDVLSAMEGCRVVAGTTAGDLRVWSVKDVYAATVLTKKGSEKDGGTSTESRTSHASGVTSRKMTRRGSITDIAAGSAFSRLKFSLRGRALSGHRGGVSCIDVPSHIYRPDALVTGGADGFIKLWSLRQPTAGRRNAGEMMPGTKPIFNTSIVGANAAEAMGQARSTRSGDALSILSGHTGRVLCIKTAWHGDRLLSGGADRTVRIWDLAGSGGKCLHALTGHLGWVTHAQYWGPNTVVSASTDRSIALYDPRVRRSPLFVLRHHYSPISDLLVGSRTDPLMVSAAADGTIATWDFRSLSGSNKSAGTTTEESSSPAKVTEGANHARAVRTPIATMKHSAEGKSIRQSGSVILSRGVAHTNTFLSVGVDAIVREWDIASGRLVSQDSTGHCDGISGLSTFSDIQSGLVTSSAEPGGDGNPKFGGIITSSWDGTVRMRKFVRK